ncbi:MAG: Ribonuclease BN [uncultured Solirubrobacteraceae bacterium]|uniref:Ribonuclease BN n=1 Tax=uncultured Solirubrobacteraceae bacterium TaxID=1162706 RepID=A0A6J4RVN9_9ACTN|nr:MAG: Ribonuclease BN [uncultured Solirubrobacteraceae bacterium]
MHASPSPASPAALAESSGRGPRSGRRALARRAMSGFNDHVMYDHAAGLTFYAMTSLFPAALIAVSLLSVFGEASLAREAADYLVDRGADDATATVVRQSLDHLLEASGGAIGLALVISILVGIYGASQAFSAAGRALNVVYAVQEQRGFMRRMVTDIGTTLLVILLFTVVLVSLFLGGGIAQDLWDSVGLGETAAWIWSFARWVVALGFALLAFAVIYSFAPDITPRRWRWITPGAVVAVLTWILASIGLAVYVRNFSTYGAFYGAFGAAIILLLWIYLAANAFLFGAELNAAIERDEKALRGGPPAVTPPPTPEHPVPAGPVR